jgi:carbon-monoxide dehydrogenase medium subunit
VKPAMFEYMRPSSLDDALTMLRDHRDGVAILSGGQSLVPMLNLRVATPEVVVDINSIPHMEEIRLDGSFVEIGARSRHNDVLRSELVQRHAPLLAMALHHVAHEAIRNRGTLGGSLALADPAAEMPACMVCLDAEIVVQSVDGSRILHASEFFQGIYDTVMEPDEIITRIRVPVLGRGWLFSFHEIARRHGDFALAGLAFGVERNGDTIAACRVAFLGVESRPRRLFEVEQVFIGDGLFDQSCVEKAVRLLASNLERIEGGEYPPEYRLYLAQQLLRRCANDIFEATRDG